MYTRAVFLAGSLMIATSSPSAFAADIYAPSAGGLKDPVIQEEVILPKPSRFRKMPNGMSVPMLVSAVLRTSMATAIPVMS